MGSLHWNPPFNLRRCICVWMFTCANTHMRECISLHRARFIQEHAKMVWMDQSSEIKVRAFENPETSWQHTTWPQNRLLQKRTFIHRKEQLDISHLHEVSYLNKSLSLKFAWKCNSYPGVVLGSVFERPPVSGVWSILSCEQEGLIMSQGHLLCWNIATWNVSWCFRVT